jgi:hypothetical protein
VDSGFATGGLAVDNKKRVIHRARLCPQAPQARHQKEIAIEGCKQRKTYAFLTHRDARFDPPKTGSITPKKPGSITAKSDKGVVGEAEVGEIHQRES